MYIEHLCVCIHFFLYLQCLLTKIITFILCLSKLIHFFIDLIPLFIFKFYKNMPVLSYGYIILSNVNLS